MRRRLKNFFKTAKNFFISVTFMKTATENPQWRTPYYSFTTDPFLGHGRVTKEAALDRFGSDFDETACYPTVTRAIIPVGSDMA